MKPVLVRNSVAWHQRAGANVTARLLAVCPLLVMAVYLWGLRPLAVVGAAVATALVCDFLAALLRSRRWQPQDLSSPLFAVLLACLMPASVSYYVIVVSTATAILVGKHLFGGFGSYPFHPTALGYVVAVVSWPAQVLSFPAPFTTPEISGAATTAFVETPAATLKLGGLPNLTSINVTLGVFAGPLGATATLVVLACGLTLLAVRRFDVAAPLGFVGICALLVRLFPRVAGVEIVDLWRMEGLVCGLAFGAVFLLQDETTAPSRFGARLLYGVLVGLLTIAYQYYGSCPYGICFGVLGGNALSGFLEHMDDAIRLWLKRLWRRLRRHAKEEQTV